MLEFLTLLIDWLGSFAMMFLGLSYSAPDACTATSAIVPVHYVESVQLTDMVDADCASYDIEEADAVEVFLI